MMPASVPFVCLAVDDFGGRADLYLNRLYSMIERRCPVPFTLTCFAGEPRVTKHPIRFLPLESLMPVPQAHPTHYKLGLFKADILPFPEFLYLDTSLVIRQNMMELLEFAFGAPQDLIILSEWQYAGYNSCAMRIRTGAFPSIPAEFLTGKRYPEEVQGDQDFIYGHVHEHGLAERVALWPPHCIVSYKWTRNYSEEGPQQMARAKEIIAASTIVKFHGNPKMHHIAKRFRNFFKSMDSSLFKRELYENWR